MYVFLGVIILICLSYYCKLRFGYEGRLMLKIPGLNGYPIIEHLLTFTLPPDKLFTKLREMHKAHRNISKMQAFGIRYVNVYDPHDLEIILSSPRFNDKEIPYTFLQPWLGEGLLISNGEKWRYRRKLLTPAFHFNILKQFLRTFIDQTEAFLEKLNNEVDKKETNVIPLIENATLSVMCETSMGIMMKDEYKREANKYFQSVKVLSECFVYRLVRVWNYVEWAFKISPMGWLHRKTVREAHDFTNKVIEKRRYVNRKLKEEKKNIVNINNNIYGEKHRLAMLDLLLENETQGVIDAAGIREEVDTFMFEGHDTTATALCFAIMRIANEPIVQDLVYEELLQIFGNSQRQPSPEDLADMKYLECCIKETLRLYPSVPMISRMIHEEIVLNGYKIPPGTNIAIQVFDLHRREDIYPEAEKFIPERFSPENSVHRHPYAYIPFSAGPRNCIGQKFAMMEMKTLLSSLLRKFRLEPITKPQDLIFTVDLTLKTNHPIYVQFVKRS